MGEELSPSQAAARIGTTTRSVQRWIASGRLPARRVGGRWRVASDVIDAFVVQAAPSPADAVAGAAGVVAGPPIAIRTLFIAIRTLFIANRGEIVTRIARTCDRLGIRSVAPSVDGTDALDLLDPDAVVAAALRCGADAVHPGFGFLAENADFAERVIDAGLRWVGPPPAAIRAMGDKATARRLAASLGVPVLPGYDDPDQSAVALTAAATRIGYPLLVKPSAGGGGKGLRTVRDPDRLPDALAAARREAMVAFGDDRLILERLVEGARHIEIQVMFDAFGTGIHLGERDCSIQRRHQKILEEAPSPAVDAGLRARLGEAAVTLARAVGYVSAGTCEFLVDDRGGASFLEMNTRLQVEHPVTELVTGRDLVADQLAIAEGRPLSIQPKAAAGFEAGGGPAVGGGGPGGGGPGDGGPAVGDVPAGAGGGGPAVGHAVEVRLYAEDAEAGFLPATGAIEALRWPTGEGIRVDAGIALGDTVGGRFDPMLAKIVAWGPDRNTALARLARALDDTVVLGLVTNLRFLRWLVHQPVVLAGGARTDTLDRIWPPDDWTVRAAIPDEAWAAAAAALTGETARDDGDPWAGGWRLNGPASIRLEAEGLARLVVGASDSGAWGASDSRPPALVRVGDTVHLDIAGRSVAFRLALPPDVDIAARAAAARHTGVLAAGPIELRAPMPGAIVAIHAVPGAAIEAGGPVVTIEAMKMEHIVTAPGPGRLAELHVQQGEQVIRGQLLAVIEP